MKNTWYKLDNVGTFYASLTNKKIPGVFRFTATMIEDVDKDILLAALKKTISLLPNINVSLKAGFFWYQLEQSNEEVTVLEDNGNVCSRIYTSKYPRLFRVTYYKKRINLELSHVLSDGRGTLEIFKVLINSYIALKYNIEINVNETSSSLLEKVEDSFDKYYKKGKKAKRAKLAIKIADDYELSISAILLGNNVVNVLAASIVTLIGISLSNGNEDLATTLSTIIFTVFIIVFCEGRIFYMHQFIYNGRSSADFNLFLSGEDTWTKALPDMERVIAAEAAEENECKGRCPWAEIIVNNT